ncbi:hypothetical protein H0X48_06300 [Candidatus Dependentiae bacterium]|nr:hypothetical protein [Candidatus Dependentiae bacterium]
MITITNKIFIFALLLCIASPYQSYAMDSLGEKQLLSHELDESPSCCNKRF